MLNQLTIKFLNDVKKLSLRFPVADISRATGYSKSNVSSFLNKKREPSDNFLKKFYEHYFPDQKGTGTPLHTLNESLVEYNSTEATINNLKLLAEGWRAQVVHLERQVTELKKEIAELKEEKKELQNTIAVLQAASSKQHRRSA